MINIFNKRKKAVNRDEMPLRRAALTGAEGIITPNEVNERHGIGIIIERFFGKYPNVLSIRSQSTLGGGQTFGAEQLQVSHAGLARWESFERLLYLLNGSTVRRVLCVPFFADDLITSICLKELFEAPLCVYVMDDNNVGAHGIPDHLFAEALQKSRLRLGISPEICAAYEQKYKLPFYVLPPLVEMGLILGKPAEANAELLAEKKGVLIGNVWSQKWLERLRTTLKDSGLRVDWFGNTNASWLHFSTETLRADGIDNRGFLPESELIEKLRQYPYAIIPSGSLDEQDDRPELARLSLPSRIPFLAATASLPLVVAGHPDTAAGRFINRFGIGKVCPYNGNALRQAANEICDPRQQKILRERTAAIGRKFTLENPAQWIWQSLEAGHPVGDRFEQLFKSSTLPET